MATPPIAFLLLLLLISPAAFAATTHNVGGSDGWNTGINYDNWAKKQTFTVGDSLLFSYDSTHTVEEVNQNDYQNCNTATSPTSQKTSPTTVALTTAGTHYFICPRSNHCNDGMKIAVNVVAAGGGSTPSTPATPGSNNPPSSSGGTTPATPQTQAGSSGAVSILGGCRSCLAVALAVGLVGLLGMRG